MKRLAYLRPRFTISGKSLLRLAAIMVAALTFALPATSQITERSTSKLTTTIKPADLRPGDVLLYRFSDPVGWLIILFQGGHYNHAAIYDGQKVLEATGNGIVTNPLAASVAKADYVDVYRLCEDGVCMGDSGFDPAPVKKGVDAYAVAGGRYAYDELFLLAGICLVRRAGPVVSPIRFIIEPIIEKAVSKINELVSHGKCIMICSELVYRCFSEAGGKYLLDIPQFLAAELVEDLSDTDQGFVKAYVDAKKNCPAKPWNGPDLPIPNFVTPRDLEESRNLKPMGKLDMGS